VRLRPSSRTLELAPGTAFRHFLQGCSGDLDPHPQVASLGERLATVVIDMIDGGNWRPVHPPLTTTLDWLDLPFVSIPDADLETEYERRLADRISPEHTRRHAAAMLRRLREGTIPPALSMPIQAWGFDGLTLLGLGHEVLSGYAEALQDEASQPLWVSAYVNEVAIYIPTDEAAPPTPSPMYWYSVGWDAGSPLVAGKESNLVAYGWPKPLRTAVHGAAANDQPSAERLLLAACRRALR
jgi:hypothetical protein